MTVVGGWPDRRRESTHQSIASRLLYRSAMIEGVAHSGFLRNMSSRSGAGQSTRFQDIRRNSRNEVAWLDSLIHMTLHCSPGQILVSSTAHHPGSLLSLPRLSALGSVIHALRTGRTNPKTRKTASPHRLSGCHTVLLSGRPKTQRASTPTGIDH